MKRIKRIIGFICAGVALATAQKAMAAESVSKQEQSEWLRWVIPLPKTIQIRHTIELPAVDVKITVRRGAGDTEKNAAAQLSALFKDKGNADGDGNAFEILIGVCDAAGKGGDVTLKDAAERKAVPNREQAYIIRPVGQNRLVLTGLDERGVFYAVQTLRQLLESRFDKRTVTIPLVSVTDWPDMAQRGEWGEITWFPPEEMEWTARHKMNMVVYNVGFRIGEDGRGEVTDIYPERIASARRHALEMVPFIYHYSILGESTNLFDVYPHLNKGIAMSDDKVVRDLGEMDMKTVPCPSEPKMAEVLADFMCDIAKAGATEIDCWLTEGRRFQCPCDLCLGEGENMHYALEARVFIKAWRIAQKQYPKLFVRITLTQGSRRSNDKVLAEVPRGVGVVYYASSWTYNAMRQPMIYPLLEDFAAKGGWLGVMPQLTSSFGAVTPWTAPQFIRYRMNEFVDKKLKCLDAYAVYSNRLYDFNVTAAAEWSWNAKGRDAREFSAAYATRRGIGDPDGCAEWAVLLGPVGWDFYGPAMYDFNHGSRLTDMVTARGRPNLGKTGLFEYFPTMQRFDEDLAVCEKAMRIAKRLDDPAMIAETQVIQGYVSMMKETAFIATQVAALDTPTYDQRVEVQEALRRLGSAGILTIDGLELWIRSLPNLDVYKKGKKSRFTLSLASVSKNVYGISDALAPFGIRPFASSYFRKKVGAWTSEDFTKKTRVTKRWDITDHVLVAGTYKVTFKNASHYKLDTFRAALASAPADNPDQLTELSVDVHKGVTYFRGNKAHIYTLTLDRLEPGLRYYLIGDIEGHPAIAHSGVMKYCKGDVWLRAVRPDNWDPASIAAKLLPLTDEELVARAARAARTKPDLPKFTGKGLRVGVIQGKSSPASTAILACLRKAAGIDAQPLRDPTKAASSECEVIIHLTVLFQPQGFTVGEKLVGLLEDFVKAGGGLISIHDAVGYRGQAELITNVCAKGVAHVRDMRWTAVKQHPVTAGLEPGETLTHSYYDHIELEPGPDGVVLATGNNTGKPVVVAGAYGKGRYVACGMIIGLSPNDNPVPPTDGERTLLENAVKWCGRHSAAAPNR